jgi:hypothetical protein
VALASVVTVAFLLAAPLAMGRPSAVAPAASPSVTPAGTFSSITVTWNSASTTITQAHTPSSAFVITPGKTDHANFTFVFSSGTLPPNTSAELTLTYLGLVLTTDKSSAVGVPLTPGKATAEVNFSFGPLFDALEGAFLLTASVVSGSGASYWSDSFYIFAKAPYLLESATIIVLLILLVVEAYWIAASVRDARRGRKSAPPVTPPTSGGPPPSSEGPPAAGTAAEATTGAEEPEPPSPTGAGPEAEGSGGSP